MAELTPHERIAANLLEDSNARIRFQHEYTLAGFRTLFLLLGGAIVALLTYAGHSQHQDVAAELRSAFVWYVGGLVLTIFGYLAAYASQEAFASSCALKAYQQLGLQVEAKRTVRQLEKAGFASVCIGIGLAVLALAAFIVGSVYAFDALS